VTVAPHMLPMPLATIGYERATLPEVIGRLKAAGVEVVIDVRAVAASRRPGFSKRMLAASLADAGMDYVHLRALGTPKAGREAARKGRVAEMRAIFEGHLAEPAAQAELAQATEIARGRRSALLCYEAAACGCHRAVVAERIRETLACDVVDL
jgi:uncharacterized protein (DUF488 family)